MGFNEMGQSVFGIVLLGIAFAVAFGGFTNQGLYEGFLPDGVTGPNDVNNYQASITVTSQGTPYGTTSTTPLQDNNPLFNFVSKDIPQYLNAFATTAAGLIDILSYIGLPQEISYVIIVFAAATMSLFAIYFAITAGVGFFKLGS